MLLFITLSEKKESEILSIQACRRKPTRSMIGIRKSSVLKGGAMGRKGCAGRIVFVLVLFAGVMFIPLLKAQAKVKIGNERYEGVFDEKYGAEVTYSLHDIVDEKKNGTKPLVKGATSWDLILHGKTLYYSKGLGEKAGIYKMNLATGKETVLIKGKNLELMGGFGEHLFIGELEYHAPSRTADKVYVFHEKTGKKKLIDRYVGWATFFSGRAVMLGAKTDVSNTDFKIFSKTGKRLFHTEALDLVCDKGKVYFSQVFYNKKDYSQKMKYYVVDKNGKNKKKITEEEFENVRARFVS